MAFSPALIAFIIVVIFMYICAFLFIVFDAMAEAERPPKHRTIVKRWTEILLKEPIIVLVNWELVCERRSSLVSAYTKSAQLVVYAEGQRITCKRRQVKFFRYDL